MEYNFVAPLSGNVKFDVAIQILVSYLLTILAKVFHLKTYIAMHKFDVICITKTCLDRNTQSDDSNLEISGYNWVR